MVDAVNSWGGGHGRDSHTEWQVTTNHTTPLPEKSQSQSGNGFGNENDNHIKVVLVGAPGVGKTSMVQQFLWGTFESSYHPTSKKETYFPSVVLHDRNYPLKIVDIPDIPFVPPNSFYNISDLQAFGLRDAKAYVLIYDLLCPDSFDYIEGLHAQITDNRDLGSIPVIVVGNKTDKVHRNLSTSRMRNKRKEREEMKKAKREHDDHEFGGHGHHGGDHGFGHGFGHDDDFGHDHDPFGGHGMSNGHGHHGGHHDKWDKHGSKHKDKHHKDKYGRKSHGFGGHSKHGKGSLWSSSHSSHSHSSRHYGSSFGTSHDSDDEDQHDSICNWVTMGRESEEILEKDIADKVENEWKAAYLECSAKDPEAVTIVFKSLMQELEDVGYGNGRSSGPYGGYSQNRHENDHDDHLRKCVIL